MPRAPFLPQHPALPPVPSDPPDLPPPLCHDSTASNRLRASLMSSKHSRPKCSKGSHVEASSGYPYHLIRKHSSPSSSFQYRRMSSTSNTSSAGSPVSIPTKATCKNSQVICDF